MKYFCMSQINLNNNSSVFHGKSCDKDVALSFADAQSNDLYTNCIITPSILRADIPHKCDVERCPLFRLYVRDIFWKISDKALMYYECKKILKKNLPDDIVTYILKKSFI